MNRDGKGSIPRAGRIALFFFISWGLFPVRSWSSVATESATEPVSAEATVSAPVYSSPCAYALHTQLLFGSAIAVTEWQTIWEIKNDLLQLSDVIDLLQSEIGRAIDLYQSDV